MNPIRPEELSALLDGELNPERTAEVRRQVHADPKLEHEFASLSALDCRLRATAATTAFVPLVILPKRATTSHWSVAITVAAGLTLARLARVFLGSASIGLALNSVELVLLLGFIVWLVRADDARQVLLAGPDPVRTSAR